VIVFLAYTAIILGFTYYNGFFGLFRDPFISNRTNTFILFGKIIAVPVFYLVYLKIYGGIEKFDTGKFYNDVQVISNFAKTDPIFYLKLLFGLQDDTPGSYDYEHCLKHTLNWDNGTVKDYLYNDNRVLIRVHSLFHFFAFDAFLAHALFNCFLSFIGIFFLYKCFAEYFKGKEIFLLLIFCFLPALWFYTGAVLKEGLCLFVMGCALYLIKKWIMQGLNIKQLLILSVLVMVSILLKPYLLLFFETVFALYFLSLRYLSEGRRLIFFLTCVVLMIAVANILSYTMKNRSLLTAALEHQIRFETVSKGGIFLTDSVNYIQLKPDSNLIRRSGTKNEFQIKKGVAYMYWEAGKSTDTLYCHFNTDTLSHFKLIYMIPESGSNIALNKKNGCLMLGSALYFSLFEPLFFNARNALQLLASFENLALLIAFVIILRGLLQRKKSAFLPIVCLVFAFGIVLLVGISAPNSGAIFRYRAPALIFIFAAALYMLDRPVRSDLE